MAPVVQTPCSYDVVPYPSYPYPDTMPSNLAMVGTLFGMSPPPVRRCRVLELGCSNGGNLIPMADAYPECSFVGIDLCEREIAEGQMHVNSLGLQNIELRHLSILDVSPDLGQFDYVICHGVYSWVSAAVRGKILAICHDHLRPNGVAYVSYNTYPGWRLRGTIRDMMSYHARRFSDPSARINQARAILDFLSESVPNDGNAYGTMLRSELDLLRGLSDSYLFHEHLEDINEPVYFHQFVEQVRSQGLQYLGDARVPCMALTSLPAHIRSTLKLISGDPIDMEQYQDFLRNRTFRETLLCHQQITLAQPISPGSLRGLYVAADMRPEGDEPKIRENSAETFHAPSGNSVSSSDPVIKVALWQLSKAWPQPIRFEALVRAAAEAAGSLSGPSPRDIAVVGDLLLGGLGSGAIELSLDPPPFIASVTDRPQATRLARFQAALGTAVTNRKHCMVELDPIDSQVLPHLDGMHNRHSLLGSLLEASRNGVVVRTADGEPARDQAHLENLVSEALDASLRRLARNSLLIA